MRFQKAVPVWLKNEEKSLNSICAFCVMFGELKSAELYITANNCYKVYLNGEFLGFGPARAAHGHYRIDVLPLKNLKKQNVLFIEAAGYNTMNYWVLDMPAFLQAEIMENGEARHWTGKDFYVRRYTERLRKVSRFSYQRAFTESYVFRESPEKTYAEYFGDGAELPARVTSGKFLPRETAYPTYGMLWGNKTENGTFTLGQGLPYRNICMEIEKLRIFPIEEWESNPSDFICNLVYEKSAPKTSFSGGEYAVFDFQRAETGFIGTELIAEEDSHICLLFDEMDLRKSPNEPSEIFPYRNGCVNIIEYRFVKGIHRHFTFEPYTARYVKAVICEGSVRSLRISMRKFENPEADRFSFWCSDERLNAIVDAAQRTFRHNSVDLLTDCPSRERAGWLCDSFFSARAEQLFTGRNRAENAFLYNYALCPQLPYLPNRMIPMCYPADFESAQYIPNWAMWYIIELYDHFLRCGDFNIAQKSREKVYGILEFLEGYRNEMGLLENLEGWVFVEWSKANDPGFIEGINFPSNMLFSKALESAGLLYKENKFLRRAEDVRDAVRKYSFNGIFFEDNRIRSEDGTKLTGHITETCQYYAFFSGVASPHLYPALFELLTEKFGPLRDATTVYPHVHKSNAFIGNYLRLIMLADSDKKGKLRQECVDFFFNMAQSTGTLWENSDPYGSLDHGFASYAANLLVRYISGFIAAHGKKLLFTEATEKIDCAIRIPVGDEELLFERKGGKENLRIPQGYECVRQADERGKVRSEAVV